MFLIMGQGGDKMKLFGGVIDIIVLYKEGKIFFNLKKN